MRNHFIPSLMPSAISMAISFFLLGVASVLVILFYVESHEDFNFYDRMTIEYPIKVNFDEMLFLDSMSEKGEVISVCMAYGGAVVTEIDNGSLKLQIAKSEKESSMHCPSTIFISKRRNIEEIKDNYLLRQSTMRAIDKAKE